MSRHPAVSHVSNKHAKIAEEYVTYISDNAVPKAMTLEEISSATKEDSDIQNVMKNIHSGRWSKSRDNKTLEIFSRLRHTLTIVPTSKGEVLLCDKKIVIPKQLQAKVIRLAHEGHQGIVKTKQLLREKVGFPGIDKQVEEHCKTCIPCLASVENKHPEPLKMTELPESPWKEVSMDFCGPFPSGTYLMIVIDDYSRYPAVEIITSTSAKAVIPHLDKIFATFGIPDIVKTDNGPPFNSHEFAQFSEYLGFKHRKITPLLPQANGEAERFMRTIGKFVKTATAEQRSWKQELNNFLRNYRATPHSTTGIPPAQLLMGRNIKTKIPTIVTESNDGKIRETDKEKKISMKTYADKKRHARESQIKKGDKVLLKQNKRDKLSTPYDPKPYEVINIKGSMITAQRDGQTVTRNSSFFKPIDNASQSSEYKDDDAISNSEITIQRRPSRQRRPPVRLKDFIVNCD